ncbi:MAG: hypothetical protein Q8P59_13125, partial [Dehalococcoidia bacterium]|nr:hypothetical protein [Dehalococcoidia bacterium]
LALCKYEIQEMILGGLLGYQSATYVRVVQWLKELDDLDDLVESFQDTGECYRGFIERSLGEFEKWIDVLLGISEEESHGPPLSGYCSLHEEHHEITAENVFATCLIGFLGLLRCVHEGREDPVFHLDGENALVTTYRSLAAGLSK